MDAIDARVDYLKIDKWMNCGKMSEVVKYCNEINCCVVDVLKIWIYATNNSDALIFGDCYFDYHAINIERNPLLSGGSIATIIEIEATSRLSHPSSIFGLEEGEIFTLCASGSGYVRGVETSHIPPQTTIIISAHNLKL